jgi:hypothetical protein
MEYKKSLEDEIDWKIIDQLHTATVNFSSSSLELKKMLFVLIGIAVPSLIKLSGDHLDNSLFVTLYILTFTFWTLDSFTYFYQEKLREKMDKHFGNIKTRNSSELVTESDFTLENSRNSKNRFWRSIYNPSTRMYPLLIFIITCGVILFMLKIIQ